jgi:predicted nucleic acid-binding Zn ribbon protein
MEEEYYGECFNCDVETEIIVHEESEPPLYCPMCGCQMTFHVTEDD